MYRERIPISVIVVIVSALTFVGLDGGAAAAAQPVPPAPVDSVVIVESCYSEELALPDDWFSARNAAGDRWHSTQIVQMSLRQISLLVDVEPLLHGYQSDLIGQTVVVVHNQSADPKLMREQVAAAMALGVNDVEHGSTTDFPTVLLYPACRQFQTAATFRELEESIWSTTWTDQPLFVEFAADIQRDMAATQVKFIVEESNATTDLLEAQLQARFGDDVRMVVDPDYSMFNWELLARPGRDVDLEADDGVVVDKSAEPTTQATTERHPERLAASDDGVTPLASPVLEQPPGSSLQPTFTTVLAALGGGAAAMALAWWGLGRAIRRPDRE